MDTQRRLLREHFVERLLQLAPRSHLDVGCGNGELVERVAAAGVLTVGVEPAPARPARPLSTGAALVAADASRLPFADGSLEWVTLRHVPHHLRALHQALAEAWRVAGVGLLLAEPWYDETRSDQRFALRADRWLKRQDRRQGRFHADVLSEDELQAALPGDATISSVETFRPERTWSAEMLERAVLECTGDVALEPDEERELANLLEIARRGALTLNGTLIVTVTKDGAR